MDRLHKDVMDVLARYPLIMNEMKQIFLKYGFSTDRKICEIFSNSLEHLGKSHEAFTNMLQIAIIEAMNGFPKPTKKEYKDVFAFAPPTTEELIAAGLLKSTEPIEVIESVTEITEEVNLDEGGMVDDQPAPPRVDVVEKSPRQKQKKTKEGAFPEGAKALFRVLFIPEKEKNKPKNKTELGCMVWPQQTKSRACIMALYFLTKAAPIFKEYLEHPESIPEGDKPFFQEIMAANPKLTAASFTTEITPWLPKKIKTVTASQKNVDSRKDEVVGVAESDAQKPDPVLQLPENVNENGFTNGHHVVEQPLEVPVTEVVSMVNGGEGGRGDQEEKYKKEFHFLKAMFGAQNRIIVRRSDLRRLLSGKYPEIAGDDELDRCVDDALQMAYDKWTSATDKNKACSFMIFLCSIKSRYDGNWNKLAKKFIGLCRSTPEHERLDVNILCDGVVVRSTW